MHNHKTRDECETDARIVRAVYVFLNIVTNENVIDDADDQRHSGGAGRGAGALSPGGPLADGSSRPGSANLSPIASKGSSTSGGAGADDETRSLNRSSRLSPQGSNDFCAIVPVPEGNLASLLC
uniref:Uncharacterized protein n=1 Tax=Anopheles melas TaxID=34690 RepID=A0A182U7U7_9DIPT